jgi:hypothetical protein
MFCGFDVDELEKDRDEWNDGRMDRIFSVSIFTEEYSTFGLHVTFRTEEGNLKNQESGES